jgi:hypothetical protein
MTSNKSVYVTRFTVALKADEKEALDKLCVQERRTIKAQAAMLIRQKLIDLGFLENDTN